MSQIISSGQFVDSITIEYDSLIVQKGGQVGYVEILDGASLSIESGGKVGTVTAEGIEYCDCDMIVYEGGKVTQAEIGPYCWATFCSGASVTSVVENGGWVDVMDGAIVTIVPHEIPVLTVHEEQWTTVHAGTTVASTYITGGGMLDVFEGATLSNITITLNGQLDAFGSISNVMVQDGGYVNAKSATMEEVYLYSGGRGVVYSKGVGSDVTVYKGGSCNVNGGIASLVKVSSGGSFTVENVVDSNTGALYQGVASTTTVLDGGVMRLVSGGSADDTTIKKGGVLDLLSGCTATNVVIDDWASIKHLGQLSKDTYLDGTCDGSNFKYANGKISYFKIVSQSLDVSDGCSIESSTIGEGGEVFIASGGAAVDTYVQMDGSMYVSAGGRATRTFVQRGGAFGFFLNSHTHVQGTSGGREFATSEGQLSGYILENGQIDIGSGGLAISTTVVSNGTLNVLDGGLASATTVSAGGMVILNEGAKAIDITVGAAGYFTVSSGGTITGKMTFEPGGYIFLESGAILDFNLTRTTAGAAALVNTLSFIDIAPTYTLTVNGTESDGKYKLAKGAEYFNSTITVRNTAGKNIGTIRTGETVSTEYADYTLELTDGELSLTISNSTGPSGDVLLANTMPQAEYMYGCAPTAVSMILGYYDLYGYRGQYFTNLIDGTVDLKSRGTDGDIYNMNAFDTVLGRATATQDYVYRFYSRGDIDVITGKKPGSYTTTSPEEELEYSFTNGGAGPDLRTDDWNCIADYLGTGQIWRGNENLSTNYTITSLENELNLHREITYTINDISRTIDRHYCNMLYGLYLYVQDKGYSLDLEITGTYKADVDGGSFTFEDYMEEIKAGRPVLISIEGHAMVGYGYNAGTREIIFDDCYEADQRMVWGGTYHYAGEDRAIKDITVIGLAVESNVDLVLVPVTGASTPLVLATSKNALVTESYSFVGSPVYLSFGVKNQGDSASGPFAVSLFVDGELTEKLSPFDLGSDDTTQQKNIALPELSIGLHSVQVMADADNDVPETSGSNNSAEQKLMVLKAGTNVITTNTTVQAGTVSTDDYVTSGWQMVVMSGGTAENTIIHGVVTSVTSDGISFLPGSVMVLEGGLVRNAEVYEYGQLEVQGSGESVHVRETGEATVGYGATLSGLTVDAGGTFGVVSDGKLTGRITIDQDADVFLEAGSILDFDLTQTTAGAESLVNDLSLIHGAPSYTITVSGEEADGTYNLAGGAAGFDKTITVKTTTGDELGTISVGGTLSAGSVDYQLNLTGATLSLTVEAEAVVPTFNTKFDVDGNGISDVMFVWTGYNYAEGYWMNGTSEWRSTMSIHPAEWETLGCYDMTGDGKADSVLVGNVEIGGNKGAYIGYYADAYDTDNDWVNIDYLNNNANVTWINKIGNLTGGEANSIVWYAPDLFTLGAWTDGTANWVTITGSFGGDWSVVGCGDFDGDGKESVLMTAGGAMYYAADLDGTVTSMGNANWSGWEVRAIGDFKGDGKDDLVVFHQTLGSLVMLADGNLDSMESIGQLDANDWFVVGAGDYNGDQKDDLLVRQYSTGMLGYYTSGDVANGWVELGRGVDMNWTVIA